MARDYVLAALLMLVSASVPAFADDGRTTAPRIVVPAASQDGAILVVFLREIVFENNTSGISDEESIVRCITDGIRSRLPHRRIVSFEEFSRLGFPNLASKARPRRPAYLGILLGNTDFRKQIAPLGLRHIVFIGGVTETKPPRGQIGCAFGDRAGACFGVISWDKRSELAVSIVDLTSAGSVHELKTQARGTAWFAIIGIIPLGMVAATETSACSEMGRRVAGALPQ